MHRDETGWILFNIKFGNVVLGDGNPSNQMSSVDEQFFHHRNARFKDETIRFARTRKRVRFFLSRKERKYLEIQEETRRKKVKEKN